LLTRAAGESLWTEARADQQTAAAVRARGIAAGCREKGACIKNNDIEGRVYGLFITYFVSILTHNYGTIFLTEWNTSNNIPT